ncbi:spermine oxidase-like isoform X2 [Mizuhopecten yessoensis]|uniref:spermine oxidase-like isoform X2 n=1 Tax=Mizuhopecten yessoensis TaxID=6573 RepID=UPI000B45862C|nr:spermine oxidase-like isoform X2 [Mizuhopecten yessoensis]
MSRSAPHHRVLVLGAGLAGLASAHYLKESGITDVVVLEADQRIGGRIYTTEFGKKASGDKAIIELGANWIHGRAHNPVYKIALEKGLLEPHVLLDRMEGHFHTEDGRRVNKDLGDKLWEKFLAIEEDCSSFFEDNIETSSTIADHFRERLAIEIEHFSQEDRSDLRLLANTMLNYLSFHIGDNLDLMSLRYDGSYDEIPGGNVKIPKGFTEVVKIFTNNFDVDTIKLGTTVTNIDWDQSKHGPSSVKVSCSLTDGEEMFYTCDHLIVTCSLGVLKKAVEDKSLFRPELPIDKCESINKIGFGKVNKIFLHYDKPFWEPGRASVKLAWSGKYADVDEKSEWYRRFYSFDEVMDNPTVLVAWISSIAAVHMEQLPETEVSKTCTAILRQFLNNPDVPEPTSVLRSSWCCNPLTLGSYSYVSMDSNPTDITTLSEPLYNPDRKPVVLFAGEATHVQWRSTTHGALDSGKREANRLVKYITNDGSKSK